MRLFFVEFNCLIAVEVVFLVSHSLSSLVSCPCVNSCAPVTVLYSYIQRSGSITQRERSGIKLSREACSLPG